MKIICVPKDSSAKTRLEYDENKPGDLIELKLDDLTFDKLWKLNLFASINKLAHSNIDNFEDEAITEIHALTRVSTSGLLDKHLYENDLHEVINSIGSLFDQAIVNGTGVYFYF